MTEYIPKQYPFNGIVPEVQTELFDEDEHLNRQAFLAACAESEKFSVMTELGSEQQQMRFTEYADRFDVRLIGLMNEWSVSDNREYTRDGLMLDGKAASQIMWEDGLTFSDLVILTQKALDAPAEAKFHDIRISIGGPDFLTEENVLETVMIKGQIHNQPERHGIRKLFGENRERLNQDDLSKRRLYLQETEPSEDSAKTNRITNRKRLLQEQELQKPIDKVSIRENVSLEDITREEGITVKHRTKERDETGIGNSVEKQSRGKDK